MEWIVETPQTAGLMPVADTVDEVTDQPQVTARVLAEQAPVLTDLAGKLASRDVRRLVLLGSGDSWFAGLAARMALEQYTGLEVEAIQAYEFAAYGVSGLDSRSALVVISSSGRPTTTWDALERALASPAFVIGMSDLPYPGNPFLEKTHAQIVPGAVKKGWPTQTTTASMAVLIALGIALGKARGHLTTGGAQALQDELRAVPEKMRRALDEGRTLAAELGPQLAQRAWLAFIGGGPSFGAAWIGSAVWASGPQRAAVTHHVEEFHHSLKIAAFAPQDAAVLIAPHGAANQRALDTQQTFKSWGSRLVTITTRGGPLAGSPYACFCLPEIPEPLSPLLTVLPLHQLSLEAAAARLREGYRRPSAIP